jgi:DNA-binding MarR family transcriptional regulator
MARPRKRRGGSRAAETLARTAPLVTRWIERLLAMNDPPLTVAQYLLLEAVDEGEVVGAELARRAAVSPAAVSQLVTALESRGLLTRARLDNDRRRQPLTLTEEGQWALRSAQTSLSRRLTALFGDMPPHEADTLAHLLELLHASLTGTPPPPRPRRPPPPPGPTHRSHPRGHG